MVNIPDVPSFTIGAHERGVRIMHIYSMFFVSTIHFEILILTSAKMSAKKPFCGSLLLGVTNSDSANVGQHELSTKCIESRVPIIFEQMTEE